MSRLALASFFLIAACLPGTLKADDADPIRAELTKAKKAHAEADAKAKATLLAAIDEAVKAVAASGDLEGVKTIQAEKKAFEESGKVPSSVRLRAAAAEYQKATRTADTALEKAYDKAIKDATKALKIDLAEAIQGEWKETTGKPSKNTEKSQPETVKAKWVPGTYQIRQTPNGVIRTYVVHTNGTVSFVEENRQGQLKPYGSGGSFTLDLGDEKLERLTFADGRVFVEHFAPKSDFGKNPPNQVGIGELVKKK
jgi:hypothetical protein